MAKETKKITWDSVKDSMVGLAPMTNNSTWSFTPSIYKDIPKEFQPTFTIKQLNISQAERIKTLMFGSPDVSTDEKSNEYTNIIHSIFVKWDNLYDIGTGEKIEYDGTDDMFKILPHAVFMAIFEEALVVGGIVPKKFISIARGA